jgi:hypothetical protein
LIVSVDGKWELVNAAKDFVDALPICDVGRAHWL